MNSLFPVESSVSEKDPVISANVHFKLEEDGNNVFYTETFPEGDSEFNFRMKFVRQWTWCVYITYWKPLNKRQEATITYDVTTNNGTPKQLEQTLFNEWIYLHTLTREINNAKASKMIKYVISNIEVQNSDEPPESPNPLLWVSSLVDVPDHSTVDLIGKNSARVQVLQWALKTNSVVFSRLFTDDSTENLQWLERKEKTLELDLDLDGLKEFKAYLYTSAAPETRAMQLFSVAHMYEIEHLKFCCAEELYSQLTPDNAMDVLKLASHYEYRPLVSALWLYYEEHLLRSEEEASDEEL